MATFTWTNNSGGTWATAADWTPTLNAPPGSTSVDTDVAIITKLSSTAYTVTVAATTTFDINTLDIGTTTGTAGDPSPFIDGTLRTDSLIDTSSSDTPTTITVDPGGVLDIRTTIGDPNAVRAVGAANGQNPLPIIVPCHRVIGSNGSLTGFGGGLENKRKLLDLESRQRRLL